MYGWSGKGFRTWYMTNAKKSAATAIRIRRRFETRLDDSEDCVEAESDMESAERW
jgi:hypothetical protein